MADQAPKNELVAVAIAEENVMPQQQQPQQQQHQQQQQPPQQQQHQQQQPDRPKPKSKNFLAGNLSGAKSKSALMRIITFVLSLPLLGIVIFLLYHGECDCESLVGLRKLRIWIIVGLILVFFLTTATVFFLKDMYALPGCLVAMLVFITLFMVGIGLVSTYQDEGRSTPASPAWIVKRVNRIYYWNDIKHCIYETRDCDDLIAMSVALKAYDYSGVRLTPLQSGCCKPPQICEMEFVNATYWKKTAIGNIYVHKDNPYFSDCDTWENNQTVLCYDCQACKDAYSSMLGWKWRKLGIFLVTMSTLLFLSHLGLTIFTIWERYSG